jgi:hypothetical protein
MVYGPLYRSWLYVTSPYVDSLSQIHERTISLKFLGIILRFLTFEVSIYNVNITNQFQTTFSQGGPGRGGGVKSVVIVNSKEDNSEDFCFLFQLRPRIRPQRPMGTPKPESTSTLCQSRLYSPVGVLGFGLWQSGRWFIYKMIFRGLNKQADKIDGWYACKLVNLKVLEN